MNVTMRPAADILGSLLVCPGCWHLVDDLTDGGDGRPICSECRAEAEAEDGGQA